MTKRPTRPPKAQDRRIVVFLTYTFVSRSEENPRVMTQDLRAWKMFIGFQHNEILVVSTSEAVITDGTDFLAHVGNGTTLVGFPRTDLMNAIDTAGDLSQIRVEIR
ncbi:COBRA-like protein [Musa troglodytarum]|uniref:COBRA-like protein n=1 Tax=Musa troglodytarum TaxID=320322 RepID=A0A9E7KAG1_9LILI|nr:COBRA-like protein [Musa troglodytarum]